jgi:chemotaxis protein MotB
MPRRQPEEEPAASVPDYMVTYGDMMSLLLTFFIMLVSMSEIKQQQRFQAMVESLRKRFGHEATVASILPGPVQPRNSPLEKLATEGRARRLDTMNGGDKVRAAVGENPRVRALRQADHATVGGVIFFPEGSTALSEEAQQILQATAREVGGKLQKIEIRGHTSTKPLPKNSPFRTHWDLAYARCTVTMEYLVGLGIDARRFRLAVAGENEPRHIGNDPLLQRENPRVEVFMLNELTEDLRGTPEERAQEISTGGPPVAP